MLHRKFTTLILLASLLAACGCGGTEAQTDVTDTAAPDSTAAEEITTEAPYEPFTKDYGGADYHIYLWQLTTLAVEEANGEILNDAIYARNRKIEDMFNINLVYSVNEGSSSNYDPWLNVINASVLAGDNDIQLAGGYGYRIPCDSMNGSYHNLLKVPHLDFQADWWPSNLMEHGNLGGAMYFAIGNIEPDFLDKTFAMLFNKKLAAQYKVGDLYALVRDGKWTLDRLMEYTALCSADLDGNAEWTDADLYGFTSNTNTSVDAYIPAFDIKITEYNKDGLPQLVGLTERYVDAQAKLKSFFTGSDACFFDMASKAQTDMFRADRSLFFANNMTGAKNLRDMESDFGILPYPKWDEAQTEYYTSNVIHNATAYMVPATADAEQAGAILEAMAYLGWRDIRPEYYERTLKGKNARDDDSAEMLDIIFDNITLEFTQIYSYSFGNQKAPSMLMRQTIRMDQDIASTWAADQTLYDETMKKLIDTLK